ncbi:hypothetical protein E4U55_004990 [Claviceps digitariae]|nr:hypothetical protein E4U55_004990 [Claviceps digitariae]
MTAAKDSNIVPSSSSLSSSAIAGIVIGVILVFVVALALFFVHLHRESTLDAWDRINYHRALFDPPRFGFNPYRNDATPFAGRRYCENAFDGQKLAAADADAGAGAGAGAGATGTAGEYYDEMEKKYKIKKYNPYETDKSARHTSRATIKAHDDSLGFPGDGVEQQDRDQDHDHNQDQNPDPDLITRSKRPSTPLRIPSLPYPQETCSIRDSFALQQYLHAAQQSAKPTTQPPQPPQPVAEPPSRPKRGIASRFPHLTLPSLSKLGLKRTRHLRISLPIATSPEAQQEYAMHISTPGYMNNEMRFRERSLLNRIMYGHHRASTPGPAPRPQEVMYNGYLEVPLRSGKSTLYGY